MSEVSQIIREATEKAGVAILAMQKTGFSVSRKENNDLLTQADVLANDILKEHLTRAFPDYGWLSEESVDDVKRLNTKYVFVVDPIDGTKEYAAGIPEYAVSVALVEDGVPIVACVFNPATHELFHAEKNHGAFLWDKRIYCDESHAKRLQLLASYSEYKRGEWDAFAKVADVKPIGSIAYKLALIAAGKADGTFSLGPKSEWDIAAGVLLVMEANGTVFDKSQKTFLFNQINVKVNGIIATNKQKQAEILGMIKFNFI